MRRHNKYEPWYVKGRRNAFAKNIDSRQPAQSEPADVSRYFSLSLNFLPVKGPFYPHDSVGFFDKKLILWIHNKVMSCLVLWIT